MSTYYVGNIQCDSDYLEHFGVKGMKWGKHLKSALENMLGITAKKQLDAAKGGEQLFRQNYQQANQNVSNTRAAYTTAQQQHQAVQNQYQMNQQSMQNNRGAMMNPGIMTTQRDVDNSSRNLQKAKANADAAVGRQNSARKMMMTAKQDVKDKQAAYDKTVAGRVDKAISKIKSGVTNAGSNIKKAVNNVTGKTAKTEYEQAKAQQNASGSSSAMNDYVESKKKAYDKSITGRIENTKDRVDQAIKKAKVDKKNAREQKDGTAAKREMDRLTRLKNTADTNNYSVKKEIAQNDLDAKKKTDKINAKLRNIDSMSGSGAGGAMAAERSRLLEEKASVEKERASKNQQAASKSKFDDAYRAKINSDLDAAKNAYASSKLGKKEAAQKKRENTMNKIAQQLNKYSGKYDGTVVKTEKQQKEDFDNSVIGQFVNTRKTRKAEREAKKEQARQTKQAKKRQIEQDRQKPKVENKSTTHLNINTKQGTTKNADSTVALNNAAGVTRRGGGGGSFGSDRFNQIETHQNQIRAAKEREEREIEEAKKKKR